LGDGGHHRHREIDRRRRHRADPRRPPDGPPGVLADPADRAGDELRARRAGYGPGPVLDSPGVAGGDRERAARTVRRTAVATVSATLRSGRTRCGNRPSTGVQRRYGRFRRHPPVGLRGEYHESVSRWLWLVKWLLSFHISLCWSSC